jgi:hypothetical protein
MFLALASFRCRVFFDTLTCDDHRRAAENDGGARPGIRGAMSVSRQREGAIVRARPVDPVTVPTCTSAAHA